ncbi:ComEA family DNA-binding protein [Pasteurellaceae bacterium TAE3-ERU1]|nr:ComEA family DNA-binding protein [Pasteurellaceae bacterium TAE3-ERU1]
MLKKLSPVLTALCVLLSAAFLPNAHAKDSAKEPTAQPAQVQAEAKATTEQATSQKVHLNSASATELQQALSGIGAKKAQAIVEYREQNGNFISIDQLEDVKGIGKATVDKNRHVLAL